MMRIAIVVSEFNKSITDRLLSGALERLKEQHIHEDHITIMRVPGAVEIPLMAKLLAKKKIFHTIICLGAVIRGETDHYDYVCQQVSQACQQVTLAYEVPVIFGILTTHTMQQAEDRSGGKKGNKGTYAADAAIKMATLVSSCETILYKSSTEPAAP